MYMTVLIIFLLVSVALIIIVMLQNGKGSNIQSSFNIYTSATLFNSSVSSNLMTQITTICAILFFVISLILWNFSSNKNMTENKWENISEHVKIEK